MKIRITLKYVLVILVFMLIAGELHEQVHINMGYMVCGDYGVRDFNAWATAKSCNLPNWSFLATATGPIFSYILMWTGTFLLLKAKAESYRAIGFSLIFIPLPFARIFTALMGGGDEKVVFLKLLEGYITKPNGKILAAVFVTAICLPPILIAWWNIKNRFAFLYVIGFCVLPLIIFSFYVFGFLNGLLANGFLASVGILGTPKLILIHTVLVITALIFMRRWILDINRTKLV